MLESDDQVHASSFRSVAASRPLESIASRGRAQCCTRLRIWGSGVRISSGAPVLSTDSASPFAACLWRGRTTIPYYAGAASSPWIAPPQRHVTNFHVEDHAGPAAASWVRCAAGGVTAASLVVTTILGSRTVKVDPRPDSLSTVMSPPIIRASLREIARPSPVPP